MSINQRAIIITRERTNQIRVAVPVLFCARARVRGQHIFLITVQCNRRLNRGWILMRRFLQIAPHTTHQPITNIQHQHNYHQRQQQEQQRQQVAVVAVLVACYFYIDSA